MATILSGSFTSTGPSSSVTVEGAANVSITFDGAKGEVAIERSFDNGLTFNEVSMNIEGHPASYRHQLNSVINEPEAGVKYRFNCVSHTSGTITYRIGQ